MQKIKRITSKGEPRYRRGPFVTEHSEEGRELTIALFPTYALLRPKGQRRGLMLPYSTMWTKACHLRAADLRRQKLEARKAKRQHKSATARVGG